MTSLVERFSGEDDPAEVMRGLHAADLYLAFACAGGCPRAHAEFEAHFMVHVGRYVASVDASAAFVDELCQLLRDKLFVGTARTGPKLLDYSGRGALGGWLRVAAVRTARNMKRRPAAEADAVDVEHARLLVSPAADPELHYLKSRYRSEFRDAFEQSLRALSSRERTILRLYYVEGLSSASVAKLYDVSGAAVRAWVKDLRATVLADARHRLSANLRVAGEELEEILGMMQSRFELTLSRVLGAG